MATSIANRVEPGASSRFNGVKVFVATMVAQRAALGDHVTSWISARPELEIADVVVKQSSDSAFHCISISVFYWEKPRT